MTRDLIYHSCMRVLRINEVMIKVLWRLERECLY